MNNVLKNLLSVIVMLALLITTAFTGVISVKADTKTTGGEPDYFTVQFRDKEGNKTNGTVKLGMTESGITGTMEVLTNSGISWQAISSLSIVSSGNGDPIMFRGTGNTVITKDATIPISTSYAERAESCRWVFTPDITSGKTEISGNIDTLLDYEDVKNDIEPNRDDYTYFCMFLDCTTLITAPELPSMTIKPVGYFGMFNGCNSLEEAPKLPATELARDCYNNMFGECYALKSAPYLPAEELADWCYAWMFTNCDNLEYIQVNFRAWNEMNSTLDWVSGVAISGIFDCPNDLPDDRGNSKIPTNWGINISAPIPIPTPTPTPKPTPKEATIKTTAPVKIGAPKLVSNKKKTLAIIWKAVPTATKYRITYSLNKKFKKGKKFGTKTKIVSGKLTLTVKKLKSKKKYFVKIEAGNSGGFGLASSVKSIKTK